MISTFIVEKPSWIAEAALQGICPEAEVRYLCLFLDVLRQSPGELAQDPRLQVGVRFKESPSRYADFVHEQDDYMLLLKKARKSDSLPKFFGSRSAIVIWSPNEDDVGRILSDSAYDRLSQRGHDYMAYDGESHYRFVDHIKLFSESGLLVGSKRRIGEIQEHLGLGTGWEAIVDYNHRRVATPSVSVGLKESLEMINKEAEKRNIDINQSGAYEELYCQLLGEVQENLRIIDMIP